MTNHWNSTIKVKPGTPLKRAPIKRRRPVAQRKAKKTKKPTLAKLKKTLWQITRQIIIRKHGTNCYTCPAQGLAKSNLQVGHFISSSVCSADLRYALENLRPQCFSCNIWKSGNWLAYEAHLKADGFDVEALKQRNESTKGLPYKSDWYVAKIFEYEEILKSIV